MIGKGFLMRKKIFASVITLIIITGYFGFNAFNKPAIKSVDFALIKNILQSEKGDYYSFISKKAKPFSGVPIEIKNVDIIKIPADKNSKIIKTNDGNIIELGQSSSATLNVEALEGLYSIKIEYSNAANANSDIEVGISVNGERQFLQADNLSLDRQYFVESKTNTNQLPVLTDTTAPKWSDLIDKSGYITDLVYFELKSGMNEIKLISKEIGFNIHAIKLIPFVETKSYAQTYSEYKNKNIIDKAFVFEAEYPTIRSDQSISELSDKVSAQTSPSFQNQTVYNTIGGTRWANPTQKITWRFTVPQDGLYPVKIRYRQDFTGGAATKRKLLIDDKVLFAECNDIDFAFGYDWQIKTIGDDTPYYFYLDSGEHVLSLSVTLGNNTELLNYARTALYNMNEIYRKIIRITTSSPDKYRDYSLDEKIPSDLEKLRKQGLALEQLSTWFKKINNDSAADTKALDTLALQIRQFLNRPDTIPSKLGDFNSNTSALGSWINARGQMPLELDLISIGNDSKKIRDNAPILSQMRFNIKNLVDTFTVLKEDQNNNQIQVWLTSGKDEESIINKLISRNYPGKQKPSIKLVLPGTQMSAIVAGVGPDVSIMNPNADGINYATRNAVIKISGFDDFNTVKDRFYDSAMIPFKLNEEYYALPEQQVFPVMFYRKDVFDELSLLPPNTINEMIGVIKKLQHNNMQFGFPAGYQGLSMFLYQSGGEFYIDNGIESGLKTINATKAFQEWTRLYSDYNVPLSYDFVNRFRTGEMPVAIANYNIYNSIKAFAPELNGLWEIAPIPGTENADGKIDRSIVATGTCAYILKSAKDAEASWEFMKWWTSDDTQASFANEMELRLGPSARYPTANKNAFNKIPWTEEQKDTINLQWKSVKAYPEVPGGYFSTRHIENAFRAAVFNSKEPIQTILDYAIYIDDELTDKRIEFGMKTKGE